MEACFLLGVAITRNTTTAIVCLTLAVGSSGFAISGNDAIILTAVQHWLNIKDIERFKVNIFCYAIFGWVLVIWFKHEHQLLWFFRVVSFIKKCQKRKFYRISHLLGICSLSKNEELGGDCHQKRMFCIILFVPCHQISITI